MSEPRVLEIVYDGPDLADVAALAGLSIDELVRLHEAGEYVAERIGFLPGFAYLGPVHPRLVVPRLPAPRSRVPARSVGLAAGFTGVYPLASPGGWRLLGRMVGPPLFDPRRASPALLAVGDHVRFRAISGEAASLDPRDVPSEQKASASAQGVFLERVLGLATVQDGLERGFRDAGVPAGGPLDPDALFAANEAVGNEPRDAAIELARGTVRLVARERTLVLSVNGASAIPLRPGESLDVSAPDAPLIVALAGGIEVEPLLGSRGTCLPGAFGGLEGRALRKGDVLPLGMSRGGRSVTHRVEALDHVELALVPGPSSPAIGDAAWETLLSSRYRLARETDRVGARLDGPKLPRVPAPELGPQPMSRGTMQITHDGTPVVLGPDCPTTGGYPVIGVLDRASQAALGRLRIGGVITVKRARIA